MIILILLNFLAAASAGMLTRRWHPCTSFTFRGIAFLLYFFAAIISSELLLGICGILTVTNLLLAHLVICLACACFLARPGKKAACREHTPGIARLLLASRTLRFTFCVLCAFTAVRLLANLGNAPLGWDSLNYHFTFAVEWMKHANLSVPITIGDDPAPTYYPLNASLYYLWLLMPLKSTWMANLGQAPYYLLAFLALYGICRNMGAGPAFSRYAALLFSLIPNYFKQLKIAYADIMVAGLFLAAVYMLFEFKANGRKQESVLLGISLGLLIGTKTLALPYSVLLFPLAVAAAGYDPGRWRSLCLAAIPLVVLGGYSYARNYFLTGNPLYPMDVEAGGRMIWKGVIDGVTYRSHLNPDDYDLGKILFHEGLGIQTTASLCIMLAGIPLFWLRGKRENKGFILYVLILPFLLALAYRYLIPLANTRYLYPAMGISLAAAFFLLHEAKASRNLVSGIVIVSLLASIPELSRKQDLVISIILSVALFLLIPMVLKVRVPKGASRALAAAALCCCAAGAWFTFSWYRGHEFDMYVKGVKASGFWPEATQAWKWLNDHTTKEKIAYTGRPVPLPLYGSGFKNEVYYASVNRTEPAKLHYFPHSRYSWGKDFLTMHKDFEKEGNYRGGARYEAWLANLRARDTSYLFVYSLHQTKEVVFPMEDQWAMDHPGEFRRVYANPTIRIYQLLK